MCILVFPAEAALVITDAQGIDCMEYLDILTAWETENLYKVIKRPGGINPITNVANLRIQVSLRAKNNLKLARLFFKNNIRNGRMAVATDITLDNVCLLREIKET